MTAVRLCAKAVVRQRWAGVLAVALLVGVGGGAVLAAAAGARRSDTAATRLYRKGAVADLEMDADLLRPRCGAGRHRQGAEDPPGAAGDPHDVLRARSAARQRRTEAARPVPRRQRRRHLALRLRPHRAAASFRGRMPDPNRTDEVIATTQEARLLHVGIGGVLHVGVAKFDDPNASTPSSFAPTTLHVVGIATTPVGLLRGGDAPRPSCSARPRSPRRFADHNVGSTVYVQLRHPTISWRSSGRRRASRRA